jgi:hypothetical protein
MAVLMNRTIICLIISALINIAFTNKNVYSASGRNMNVLVKPEIQKAPIVFYHESYNSPKLNRLVKKNDYTQYASLANDEFEKIKLLKDWVYKRMPYDLNFQDHELRNALKILNQAKKGKAFLCTHFSTVFMECAISLGLTSRYFFLKMPTGEEHAGTDVWSNQFRKWVYIDTTWNIHVEKNKIPLSLLELRTEWIKGGHDIEYVFGAGEDEKRYTCKDFPIMRSDSTVWKYHPIDEKWLSYTYQIAMVGRNDFFYGGSGSELWNNIFIVFNENSVKEKFWNFTKKINISNTRSVFHDCNRVTASVSSSGKTDRSGNIIYCILLDSSGQMNYSPYFKDYQLRVNDNKWTDSASGRVEIKLRYGWNIIYARVRNKFGVVGPISEIPINTFDPIATEFVK